MTKWDYCLMIGAKMAGEVQCSISYFEPTGTHRKDTLDCDSGTALARLGRDGWDMISVVTVIGSDSHGQTTGSGHLFYLKRPVT